MKLNYGSNILLVGDISSLLLDRACVSANCFEVCAELSEAISKAAENCYDVIAIVMPKNLDGLSLSLKALRRISKARILLLTQMFQEPMAMQLVDSVCNEIPLADDYLIYPIRFSSLISCLSQVDYRFSKNESRIVVLEKLATEDDLTGLKNRRYILEFSRQVLELAKKENKQATLLVFDIDNFKRYNDNYGHGAGDEILREAAALMKCCCRDHDVVGRIGGDEFAVVFWDDPSDSRSKIPRDASEKRRETKQERRSTTADHPTEAIYIAKRLAGELERAEISSFAGLGRAGKGVLTISGGLASFPRDGHTVEELFQQADKALMEAKRSGKNRIYLVGQPQTQGSSIRKSEDKDSD